MRITIPSWKRLLTVLLVHLVLIGAALATDLRGLIQQKSQATSQVLPLFGARIDLYVSNGTDWVLKATTYSGQDGLYYFLSVPPGSKILLRVNEGTYYPAQVGMAPSQDLSQITI